MPANDRFRMPGAVCAVESSAGASRSCKDRGRFARAARRPLVSGVVGVEQTDLVPLTDRLAGELQRVFDASAFQRDDDLVFTHPHSRKLGTPLDGSKVRKRFKDALERASIRPVRFHDLRHTFGTRMAAAGVPMRTLQEWLGHRDFTTTLVYADYAPSAPEAEWVEAAFSQESASAGAPGEVGASEI
jgi:integrase